MNQTRLTGTGIPSAPPQPASIRKLFFGPNGLRSGWRFLTYLAAFFALLYGLGFIIRPLLPHPANHQLPPLWVFLVGECQLLVAAVVPAVIMARVEDRTFGTYGLPTRAAFGRLFWIGLVWGFVAITLLLLVMRGIGVFYFGGLALHGLGALKFAGFWAVLFLTVGFFEEFMSRGYTQFTLTQGIGFWPAAILLSVAFGAIHLSSPREAWVGALGAGCIGLFFCLTLRRTGSLWFAVGMHAAWDWGETFFYSVPDSGLVAPGHLLNSSFRGSRWLTGGSIGPEGSVLIFVLIGLLFLLFNYLYPEANYHTADKLSVQLE